MAIDTKAKRFSIINMVVLSSIQPLPPPDGSGIITVGDKSHLLGVFSGNGIFLGPPLYEGMSVYATGIIPAPRGTGAVPPFRLTGVV